MSTIVPSDVRSADADGWPAAFNPCTMLGILSDTAGLPLRSCARFQLLFQEREILGDIATNDDVEERRRKAEERFGLAARAAARESTVCGVFKLIADLHRERLCYRQIDRLVVVGSDDLISVGKATAQEGGGPLYAGAGLQPALAQWPAFDDAGGPLRVVVRV